MLTTHRKFLQKIALGIEYEGNKYCGWQRQIKVKSIQEQLENAISIVANEQIHVNCAARTDANVHSIGQVVHFETTIVRKSSAWTLGVNSNLPKNIGVNWIKFVPHDFHARFSAISRNYRYIIYNQPLRPAILNHGVMHFYKPLNAESMHRAAQYLIGENDFTSFRAAKCQSNTPWRNIMYISVNRFGKYIIIDIKANSYVYRMVRNIVGSLIQVGTGCRPEIWIAELLAAKDRTLAAPTAKANGLYLISVDYPDHYNIPKLPISPLF